MPNRNWRKWFSTFKFHMKQQAPRQERSKKPENTRCEMERVDPTVPWSPINWCRPSSHIQSYGLLSFWGARHPKRAFGLIFSRMVYLFGVLTTPLQSRGKLASSVGRVCLHYRHWMVGGTAELLLFIIGRILIRSKLGRKFPSFSDPKFILCNRNLEELDLQFLLKFIWNVCSMAKLSRLDMETSEKKMRRDLERSSIFHFQQSSLLPSEDVEQRLLSCATGREDLCKLFKEMKSTTWSWMQNDLRIKRICNFSRCLFSAALKIKWKSDRKIFILVSKRFWRPWDILTVQSGGTGLQKSLSSVMWGLGAIRFLVRMKPSPCLFWVALCGMQDVVGIFSRSETGQNHLSIYSGWSIQAFQMRHHYL